MAKCAPKKPVKNVTIKDLAPRKNPKGGMNKAQLIDAVATKAGLTKADATKG